MDVNHGSVVDGDPASNGMLTLSDEILPATNINQLRASGMPGEFQFHANRLSDIGIQRPFRFGLVAGFTNQCECCEWHVHNGLCHSN